MPKPIQAAMLVSFFEEDADGSKEKKLRGSLKDKTMIRRDTSGKKIADNKIKKDKGKPKKP